MRKALQRQTDQSQIPTRELSPRAAHSTAPQHSFGFSEIDIFPNKGAHVNGAGIAGGLRTQMEASFQSDFSGLKIFEDQSVSSIHAKAYAQGEHLYFAPGRFDPTSQAGLELIGHELAHVVQQRQGVAPNPLFGADMQQSPTLTQPPAALPWSRINTDRALEREADALGRLAARGERATVAPRSGVTGSVAGAAVIQASPEDEARLHSNLEQRAYSVWQSHNSPEHQDQSARMADWNKAQGQQKSEIERRANLEYHKRFTADPSDNVSAPAHSDQKMVEDYSSGEEGFRRELRNREYAANPTNTDGKALTTSGEFDSIGQSVSSSSVTPINQRTPDPSNPEKLSEARKNLLQTQLDHSGRTNIMMPTTAPPPIDSSLKTSDPVQYASDLKELGNTRHSGIQSSVVDAHLKTYLSANSDDAKSATGHAPLGHAHSAHGFHIPLGQQVDRLIYGIRPDERVTKIPNGTILVPGGIPGLAGKGKDPVEQAKLNAITSVSSFPTPALKDNVGSTGKAGGFTSSLAEYNSLNQNLAQAWQSKDQPGFAANKNVAVTSQNLGNPVGSTNPNASSWKPEAYGLGFEFNPAANAPNLVKNDTYSKRTADTQSRAAAIVADQQNSSKTVVKKLADAQGRMNGFDVTTNYPNNDAQKVDKLPAILVDSTFQPTQTNARDEEADLAESMTRIGGSTTGNIPYWRDIFGELVTDSKTGNPLPELDNNSNPIKQRF